MKLIIRILATAFIVVALARFLPGTHIDNYLTGIWVAIVLGLINIFIKPLLIILTLPVTIFTFGLFLLVINALLVLLSSELVSGFYVKGFWWALLFSLLLSFFQSVLFSAFEKKNENLHP
ncbi:MAG TPA: phage holin family protein [Flavobacteriaceae bacterium]|nr:phage holin family protein [Flavobacteriaceae bacterium]